MLYLTEFIAFLFEQLNQKETGQRERDDVTRVCIHFLFILNKLSQTEWLKTK